MTKNGVVYATLSSGGNQAGVWRSTDNGTSWINITPSWFDNTSAGRIIICIAPSDEKQVYFAANTPGKGNKSLNFEGTEEWNSFWKYTYISGDGSGTGGTWDDRSLNLPKLGGAFGDYISQSGYCMGLSVKPDDANAVYLGGTNLYRSTDGFSTSTKTTWIGGYLPGTFLPDFKLYAQHHPDQHGVIFYPSDPKKMISVNDGGISLTNDNIAPNINWTSLNNGYITTQFYSVAMDHQSTSNVLIGGLQDNGTLFTNSANTNSNWSLPLSYDGSFCYVAPGGGEYYMSIQQGRVMRLKLDVNGTLQQYARVDPKGQDKSKYQFVNPFTPDATDWHVLYIPAGNVLWRNSDITGIALKNQPDSNSSDVNWQKLSHTTLPVSGDAITAVLSSKQQHDVLYYATSEGNLYRLQNASDTASLPQSIKGANFPLAYINCIAQNQSDSNKLYVVFTNYNILSVFYSSDGGASWTAISGNLEQNANGSGNGPSCRWITLAPVQDSMIFFLGTSTGLYATKQINGMQTQWSWQAYNQIKNNIVMMMDYRTTDGLLAVATYGAGMFTTKITSLNAQTNIVEHDRISALKLYPNPGHDVMNIELPEGITSGNYEVWALNGVRVLYGKMNAHEKLDLTSLPNGFYHVGVQTGAVKYDAKFLKQ